MVPISSKTEKYKRLYEEKKKRYKEYDGLRFGYVNGQYRAFLIQNVCPVIEEFIDCQYMIENNTVPVTINDKLSSEINGIVRKVTRPRQHRHLKRKDSIRFLVLLVFSGFFIFTR